MTLLPTWVVETSVACIAATFVVLDSPEPEGRTLGQLRWGLIPAWTHDLRKGPPLINARGETVATTPTFRTPFRRQRCLIPADGFYEWQKLDAKHKQPFHIRLADHALFAFAGLWDRWKGPEGPVESCAIITTEANELVRPCTTACR
jgi:putative SOS response-associated peptidase YedK